MLPKLDMKLIVVTILLLIVSNIFMTLAWYGHLRLQQAGVSGNWPLYVVILFSWGIALAEYCFMIPANRIGFEGNGGPFSLFQGQKFHWNHLAAFLCLIAAVVFAFLPVKS